MTTKGKKWTWGENPEGRKKLSEATSERMRNGQAAKMATKHGLSRHPSYNHWKKMMQRCYDEGNPYYSYYGGRGIEVCDRWHDVANFIADMGHKPNIEGVRMSLERLDVNGDYRPNNCVWLPLKLQSKNRRPWKHTEAGLDRIRQARRN